MSIISKVYLFLIDKGVKNIPIFTSLEKQIGDVTKMEKTLWTFIIVAVASLALIVGCSDYNNPTEPKTEAPGNSKMFGNVSYSNVVTLGTSESLVPVESTSEVTLSIDGTLTFLTTKGAITYTSVSTENVTITAMAVMVKPCEPFPNGGYIFKFGPAGAVFDPPASGYLNWRLPEALEADQTLRLKYWDKKSQTWITVGTTRDPIPDDIRILNQETVGFKVPHFSLWGISRD